VGSVICRRVRQVKDKEAIVVQHQGQRIVCLEFELGGSIGLEASMTFEKSKILRVSSVGSVSSIMKESCENRFSMSSSSSEAD